ncbi:MAG: hypothetical protein ABH852_04585 [Methanobacteriota archaeon]
MVYCLYCGTKNNKNVKVCKKCGEKLYPVEEAKPRLSSGFGPTERRERHEQECFGFPQFGAIIGLTIGLLIMLFGVGFILSRHYKTSIEIWPMAVVIFGIIVVTVAFSSLRRGQSL